MDLSQTIRDLHAEKAQFERAISGLECIIAQLEALALATDGSKAPVTPPRRGRKWMGLEERLQVSERMRRYWAKRRATAPLEDLSDSLH